MLVDEPAREPRRCVLRGCAVLRSPESESTREAAAAGRMKRRDFFAIPSA